MKIEFEVPDKCKGCAYQEFELVRSKICMYEKAIYTSDWELKCSNSLLCDCLEEKFKGE